MTPTKVRWVAAVLTAAAFIAACGSPTPNPSSAAPENPTGTPSSSQTGPDPSTSATLPVTSWIAEQSNNIPIQVPDTWKNTIVPGADNAWTTPSGAAVGLTLTTPNPTPLTRSILEQLSETTLQNNPQLAAAGDIEKTPQRGYLKFVEGATTLHVWLTSTPSGVWTVTLGHPYQQSSNNTPAVPDSPQPTQSDVTQVEMFIERNNPQQASAG